jgi:CubicO group peptidase (beta-lactamase class C family)
MNESATSSRLDPVTGNAGDAPERPSLADWDRPPFNRWSFRNMTQLFPTAPVSRGPGPSSAFERRYCSLGQIPLTRFDGSRCVVDDILGETYTDGFIVLHRGAIVSEQYFDGMTPETRHLAQSVSKSMTGCLAGILVARGLIDLDAPVTDYVPELARGGYDGAKLRHLLDMRSGVRFTEDYTDPDAEFVYLDMAAGWKERTRPEAPSSIHDLLVWVKQERPHGGDVQYRSLETDVVAWVCERAAGLPLNELLSNEIWRWLGAEQDGCFTVDRRGTCLADGGFNATLRDFARFGQMCLDNGFFNGRQIVPGDWLNGCRHGDVEGFVAHHGVQRDYYPAPAYSRQWWVLDNEAGVHCARGVFGQLIHIDPIHELVAVKLSSWPDFLNTDYAVNTYRAIQAIARYLTGERPESR